MSTQNTTTTLELTELLLKSRIGELIDYYTGCEYDHSDIQDSLDRLLNCYVVSDFIEGDDREERNRIVTTLMKINHILKMLEGIKKLDAQILQAKNAQS